jgi:transposase
MPAPYSYALRKKAIEAVKRGERKIEVCRLLKISRNTLDLWIKKEKATGDYQAITKGRRGRKLKIQDPSKFREFIRENPKTNSSTVGRRADPTKYKLFL